MTTPELVDPSIKKIMSFIQPVKPLSTSQKFNIILCIILFLIPFILYYFYKTKKSPKQKKKELSNFVKYVKANTKKNK
jgi:preprotein translocase subunit SecG|tara:strand:+ start:60 stop:293 length:234 start_codon:yes stop_codon:yes gene_type:complete